MHSKREPTHRRVVGKRFHKKEGIALEWRERRPKKSKEISTSVNTYVDFKKAGLFI